MPTFNEQNVRHLLRRAEFVDRPDRVDQLMALGSIEAAVDDVMNVSGNVGSASFAGLGEDDNYRKGMAISEHWMNRMATIQRPLGERMAFFWHGHICTSFSKVDEAEHMREQIDLFRNDGLGTASNGGNVSDLMIDMSTQSAMLVYLDNAENFADSPNQNFARELMELFLLGVGNYTEADVEAATAAWTGHTARWPERNYEYLAEAHEPAPQQLLGRTINSGSRPLREAGQETIEVILGTGPLGTGTVPAGADINAGRPTNVVAAEFLSKKLWQEFGEAASRSVPTGVLGAMTNALIDNGFDIRPWVRAMLVHDDFYATATKEGLVRQPVEFVIALLSATGLSAEEGASMWLMDRAGQRLLYPPNVSGWKPNGYWVNASAMGARQRIAQGCVWNLTGDEWDGDDGYLDLPGGRIQRSWLQNDATPSADVVDTFLDYTGLAASMTASSRQAMIDHLDDPVIERWQRLDVLLLTLSAPEIHIA